MKCQQSMKKEIPPKPIMEVLIYDFMTHLGFMSIKRPSALTVVQGPLLDSILFPTTTYSLHCHDGSYTWSEENSPQSTQLKS